MAYFCCYSGIWSNKRLNGFCHDFGIRYPFKLLTARPHSDQIRVWMCVVRLGMRPNTQTSISGLYFLTGAHQCSPLRSIKLSFLSTICLLIFSKWNRYPIRWRSQYIVVNTIVISLKVQVVSKIINNTKQRQETGHKILILEPKTEDIKWLNNKIKIYNEIKYQNTK